MVALQLHAGVPVSRKKVMKWKRQYYAEATGSLPANMPYMFKIAVVPGESGPEDVSKRWEAFVGVSARTLGCARISDR